MENNTYWRTCYDELYQQHNKQISFLQDQIRLLHAELAKYKPAEPKFKVGQVVISKLNGYECSFWIHHARFVQTLNEQGWYYSQQRDEKFLRWVPESQLRGMTPLEKGD